MIMKTNILKKIFNELMASTMGGDINSDACEINEHYIVLHFWDGRRFLLTCPFLEMGCEYDPATAKTIE